MALDSAEQLEIDLSIAPQSPEQLDTVGKLRAVYDSEKFIPTTHLEKNNALALLDYALPTKGQTNPGVHGHPAGAGGQLQEILLSKIKLHQTDRQVGVAAGQEAIRSVVHSFGNFLANSVEQKAHLSRFSLDVSNATRPDLSVAETVGLHHPGLPAFIRFFDLSRYRKEGKIPVFGFDPLKTLVARKRPDQVGAKKVYDQYTNPEPLPEVVEQIQTMARLLQIGPLNMRQGRAQFTMTEEAIREQQFRINFWTARIREARNHRAAIKTADVILGSLGIAIR